MRAVREECLAVRDAAGILDLPGFSRFRVSGPDVAGWLARQITGKVPGVGRLGLAYFADDKGRIVTEMSVARMAEDEVLLITAATAQAHDREWLLKHLDPGLTLVEETDAWSTPDPDRACRARDPVRGDESRPDEALAFLAVGHASAGPRCC